MSAPINVAVTHGRCLSVEPLAGHPTMRLYHVKPLIGGKYGNPIRVVATWTFTVGNDYSFYGCIDTMKIDSVLVPVIKAYRPVRLKQPKQLLGSVGTDDLSRVKAASFFYITHLTVKSVVKIGRDYIVGLYSVTPSESRLTINVLELFSATTSHTREVFEKINVGEKISILGALYQDPRFSKSSRKSEIGARIFRVNPTEEELADIVSLKNVASQ